MGNFAGMGGTGTLKAVLFDRDGTLVVDVPYNGDPRLVRAMDHARAAVDRARSAGLATGVASNQSGVARGLLSLGQVDAVNRRIDQLFGAFDVWEVCPHRQEDNCGCRKPAPGLIINACRRLGVEPGEVAYVGDIGADVEAARAAGVRHVLVPTPATRVEEVECAGIVARDLWHAVDILLGPPTPQPPTPHGQVPVSQVPVRGGRP